MTTHPVEKEERGQAGGSLHRTPMTNLLSREQLRAAIGRGQKTGSFNNWLARATRERRFPRPLVIAGRSVAWRQDEVQAWIDAQPRSDASRSPRAGGSR
jgi:predicted DNA-binding transcriptional regulator AlpA